MNNDLIDRTFKVREKARAAVERVKSDARKRTKKIAAWRERLRKR